MAIFNDSFDSGNPHLFTYSFFTEEWELLLITGWTFRLTMKLGNTVIWDILDGDFTRPASNQILHQKSIADVNALAPGIYTYTLFVTNSSILDDEYITGTLVKE